MFSHYILGAKTDSWWNTVHVPNFSSYKEVSFDATTKDDIDWQRNKNTTSMNDFVQGSKLN